MSTNAKKNSVYKLTALGILTAIIIVLQIFTTFVRFGPFSITLALIPMVVGAAMFGKGAGAYLGAVLGVIVTIMSATGGDVGGFMVWSANPFLCTVLCILKTAAAGFFAGAIYSVISKIKRKPKKMESMSFDGAKVLFNKRRVGLCIFLSIITCGLYYIYWQYLMVKNYRTLNHDESGCLGEMLCLIFIPFYSVYWFYTRGEVIRKKANDNSLFVTGKGVVYLLLSLFGLNIVSLAIMQFDYDSFSSETVYVERDNKLAASALAAFISPITNTGIFIIGMLLFFKDTLAIWAGGSDLLTYIILGLTGVNFLVELGTNMILSPVVVKIIDAVKKTSKA